MSEYSTNKLSIDKTTDKDSIQLSSSSGSVKLNLFNDTSLDSVSNEQKISEKSLEFKYISSEEKMPANYKVFTGVLQYDCEVGIIVNELENTIGDIVWGWNGESFTCSLDGAFPVGKWWALPITVYDGATETMIVTTISGNISTLYIGYRNFIGEPIVSTERLMIEIRVYN